MSTPVPGVATAQEPDFSNWNAGFLVVNPLANTLLVQSAPLGAGIYHVALVGWASIDARFRFARRNVADSADIKNVDVPVPANNPVSLTMPTIVEIAEGETFKITNLSSVTGTVQASLLYARVG